MNKIMFVILLVLNIVACEPVQQASQNKKSSEKYNFICLASQSECEVNTDFGRYTVQFSENNDQGNITTEHPFTIKLTFVKNNKNYQLKKVISYLEGKDMFMGKIPVFFQSNEKTPNSMIAETLLANCSEEVMTWRLWFQVDIVVEGASQQQIFFIDFDSQRL